MADVAEAMEWLEGLTNEELLGLGRYLGVDAERLKAFGDWCSITEE